MGVILIVDDEPVTQLMLELMLQRGNHTVILADDGQDAITQLKRESVDLVIADVNMPKMDGLTMLQKLRRDDRHKNLPVIMFTANSKSQIHLEAKRKGATDILTKPVSSWKLAEIVTQNLSASSV
ncbi:MAG: response regulator [Chloroflexi bacterium]|nr:response regulator [Chloroflexota bacterium]